MIEHLCMFLPQRENNLSVLLPLLYTQCAFLCRIQHTTCADPENNARGSLKRF